jgi:hypothetical protein
MRSTRIDVRTMSASNRSNCVGDAHSEMEPFVRLAQVDPEPEPLSLVETSFRTLLPSRACPRRNSPPELARCLPIRAGT